MALPNRLKSARIVGASAVSGWPTTLGQLEQAICDLLGISIDTDYSYPVGGGGVRYASIADGTLVTNTVTETAWGKSYTIPAGTLRVGDLIRLRADVQMVAYNSGNVIVKPRLAGVAVGQATFAGFINPRMFGFDVTVRSIGAAGSLLGIFYMMTLDGGGFSSATYNMVPTAFDTTGALVVDGSFQWSAANAGNQIKITRMTVEVISAASTS